MAIRTDTGSGGRHISRHILCLPIPVPDDDRMATAMVAAGWHPVRVPDAVAAVAALRLSSFALVCHPADLPDAAARLIRTQAVPVLVVAGSDLPTAADLDRHAVPTTATARPDPLARLTPLFGRAGIAQLLARFRGRLAAVLDAPDPLTAGEGTTVPALAHRIVGMAGMLDFPELAAAWSAVETGGERHWPDAWTETRIARAMLDRILERITPG